MYKISSKWKKDVKFHTWVMLTITELDLIYKVRSKKYLLRIKQNNATCTD